MTTGIIGMFTLVAIPGFQQCINRTNETAVGQALRQIHNTMEELYLNQNEYPPSEIAFQDLGTWATPVNLATVGDLTELIGRITSKGFTVQYHRPDTSSYIFQILEGSEILFEVSPAGVVIKHGRQVVGPGITTANFGGAVPPSDGPILSSNE